MHASPASIDAPQARAPAPPCWVTHRRPLLWTLAILLLVGWWWWHLPRSYHQVARINTSDITLLPSASGFLLREAYNDFVLRDWRTGQVRWQVTTTAPPRNARKPNLLNKRGLSFSLSPSGSYFAVAVAQQVGMRVQTWHDGQAVGDQILPADAMSLPRVKVLDTGRAFVWLLRVPPAIRKDCPVVVVEGNAVVARGAFPPDSALSPDGAGVLSGQGNAYQLCAVTVEGGKIHLSPPQTVNDEVSLLDEQNLEFGYDALFAEGVVLTDHGAVVRPAGQVVAANQWSYACLCPGGRYTVQSTGDRERLYSPVTGESWGFQVAGEAHGGDATMDGRYVLAYFTRELPAPLPRMLQWLPPFRSMNANEIALDYVALYERPGRLRAALRLDVRHFWRGEGSAEHYCWFPSPDGRAVVLNMDGGLKQCQCLLFRW